MLTSQKLKGIHLISNDTIMVADSAEPAICIGVAEMMAIKDGYPNPVRLTAANIYTEKEILELLHGAATNTPAE